MKGIVIVVLNLLKIGISLQIDMLVKSAHKLAFFPIPAPPIISVCRKTLRAIWQSVYHTWIFQSALTLFIRNCCENSS